MREECVSFHNAHPETPRSDWRVGDVRGVLEVALPIDRQTEQAGEMLRSTFALLAGVIALALVAVGITTRSLRRHADEKYRLESQLTEALTHALSGFIPICAWCRKVRKDESESDWIQIESYIGQRTEAQFSHGICPECAREQSRLRG